MGVTAIKQVINVSPFTGTISNLRDPDKPGNSGGIDANGRLCVDIWIPWCTDAEKLNHESIVVQLSDGSQLRSWRIYQRAAEDGDFVRLMDISDPANFGDFFAQRRIGGLARVDGDRDLIIDLDGNLFLQEH